MASKKKQLSPRYQVWVDARKKFRLSHAHIQMARELGLNPKKFGSLANHEQEKWKAPLPQFIEDLYFERFGMESPEVILTIEQIAQKKLENKSANRDNHQEPSVSECEDDQDDDPLWLR